MQTLSTDETIPSACKGTKQETDSKCSTLSHPSTSKSTLTVMESVWDEELHPAHKRQEQNRAI